MILDNYPLVTVICLCYNHAAFVEEALLSVLKQTYKNVQIIVADDGSNDCSAVTIENFISLLPDIRFIKNVNNLGNCTTFNKALAFAQGKYIIDLAADDILLNDRIEKQVTEFEKLPCQYGVLFSDVFHISENGKIIGRHHSDKMKVPQGDVYKMVLEKFFISAPSMMIRKKVLDELGGYDESLAYEDFDFWVRSSRKYLYYYMDEVLTLKRMLGSSLSQKFYLQRQYQLQFSTYKVCEKALGLNMTIDEDKALVKRINYQILQAFWSSNSEVVPHYRKLLAKLNSGNIFIQFIILFSSLGIRPVIPYLILRKVNHFLNTTKSTFFNKI